MAGATPKQVVFTSSASEAITQAIGAGAKALGCTDVVISAGEHKAVMRAADASGLRVSVIGLDADGRIDVAALAELLVAAEDRGPTFLVAVHAVNSETGIVQDMQRTGALVGASRHFLFVDAVQAFGKLPLDFAASAADMMAVSAHKIGGPKGAGALVARGEAMMPSPLVRGGGQEKGHRSGTENAASIAGFGVAAGIAANDIAGRAAALRTARDAIEARMRLAAPELTVHGAAVGRLPNTAFFSLPGLKSETGQIAFDLEGIALSAGSACSSGKVGESHVLKAMGLDPRMGALRISIGTTTTEEDIERTVAAFAKIAGRLTASRAA